jgi:hypothetical protein
MGKLVCTQTLLYNKKMVVKPWLLKERKTSRTRRTRHFGPRDLMPASQLVRGLLLRVAPPELVMQAAPDLIDHHTLLFDFLFSEAKVPLEFYLKSKARQLLDAYFIFLRGYRPEGALFNHPEGHVNFGFGAC